MINDPTDGCAGCGTFDAVHAVDCVRVTAPPEATEDTADLPPFTGVPVDRLAHTLAVYADQVEPDDWAIRATTGGVVPGHVTTGLTWRDLAELLAIIRVEVP